MGNQKRLIQARKGGFSSERRTFLPSWKREIVLKSGKMSLKIPFKNPEESVKLKKSISVFSEGVEYWEWWRRA